MHGLVEENKLLFLYDSGKEFGLFYAGQRGSSGALTFLGHGL